jgi:hypothetical protein
VDTPRPLPAISQSQHFRWLELAALSRAAAEFVILLAWYIALARPAASLVTSSLVLTGLLVTCWLLVRLSERQRLSDGQQNFVIILWVLAYAFASFQPTFYPDIPLKPFELFTVPLTALLQFESTLREFWHLVIITLVAWRGITAGRQLISVETAMNSFRTGLVLLLIFGAFYSQTLPPSFAIALITAYFFLILTSLTAARVAEVGELRGGRIPRLNTGRGLGILVGALVVAVIAGLLGLLGTQTGTFVTALVLAFLALLAVALLVLATPFLALVVWLLSKMPTLNPLENDMESNSEAVQETVETAAAELSQSMDLLTVAGRPVLMLLVLIGLFGLIYLALRARARRPQTEIELDAEQLVSRRRFTFPQILEALQNRGRRAGIGQALAAARIRQTYHRLMQLCRRLDVPRPPAATPIEFLPVLQELYPGDEQAVAEITHAYNKIRYGEYPESREEVQAVLAAWRQIEKSSRQLLKEHKAARRAYRERSTSRWG